jgi:hypothetical protein
MVYVDDGIEEILENLGESYGRESLKRKQGS